MSLSTLSSSHISRERERKRKLKPTKETFCAAVSPIPLVQSLLTVGYVFHISASFCQFQTLKNVQKEQKTRLLPVTIPSSKSLTACERIEEIFLLN